MILLSTLSNKRKVTKKGCARREKSFALGLLGASNHGPGCCVSRWGWGVSEVSSGHLFFQEQPVIKPV